MNNYWWQLVNDARAWEAIDSLLLPEHADENGKAKEIRSARGCLPEESVFPMLQEISLIPSAWDETSNEHPSDASRRRMKLAARIRMLSEEIRADREAAQYKIINSQEITQNISCMNGVKCRAVHEVLADFADTIEKHRTYADGFAELRGEKRTRDALHQFVAREVARCVGRYLVRKKSRRSGERERAIPAPRKEIVNLINAVLGLYGECEKTQAQLAHVINNAYDSDD